MRNHLKAILLVVATVTATLVSSCSKPGATAAEAPKPPAPDIAKSTPASASGIAIGGLTKVEDRSLVCMVNNQFMGRPQIPVQVDGKTYFGCCEMCKERLAKDANARTAIDPFSQRPIDKSLAVIAKAETGVALYFENEANLLAYSQRTRPQ